jgi:hypothetical protein
MTCRQDLSALVRIMLQSYELGDEGLPPDFILVKIDDGTENNDGYS